MTDQIIRRAMLLFCTFASILGGIVFIYGGYHALDKVEFHGAPIGLGMMFVGLAFLVFAPIIAALEW